MMNLNNRARGYMDYSDIDVLFANNTEEAMQLIDLYNEKGYTLYPIHNQCIIRILLICIQIPMIHITL